MLLLELKQLKVTIPRWLHKHQKEVLHQEEEIPARK
jgi:hypothetical protein